MVYCSCSLNLMFTVFTVFSIIFFKKKVGNKHGNRVFHVLIVFLNKKKKEFSKTVIKHAIGF